MKKLMTIVLFVLIPFVSFATNATNEAGESQYWVEEHEIIAYGSLDTLAGGDSVKVKNDLVPAAGWQYIIVNNTLTGDSAANSIPALIVKGYDENDSLVQEYLVDTLEEGGSAITLPLGEEVFGRKYDIYVGVSAANDETVINGLVIYRRKSVVNNRKLTF